MEIGKKIRKFRKQNGLTLEELASRTELTKGFLSQIENDITSPSISTLNDIVEVLGMDMSTFFKDDRLEQIVFKKEDFFIDEKDDSKLTWLIPNAQKNQMEPILLELEKNAESDEIIPHDGEEFAYVLKGKVTLIYGDEKKIINQNETFYITGEEPHRLINEFETRVQVLWVCTPPIF